jgi:CheY-like chemotaxis protein
MLRRLIGEHVTLHSAVDPEAGLVRADRGQIEQVLMNLVINARDAMPDGGTITISTARTYLSQSEVLGAEPLPAGAYVVLAVADEGTGMSEETRLRIFEPFFTTKGPGRGTGLGLATVFGIVTQLKGGIRVDSAVGQGTTFSIYLPLADEPAAAVVATRHATPDVRHHETILLVEDEAPVRDLARMILERGGYRVFQASDPLGAEELFDTAAGMADVLVTDVIMPGGRGTDLFARLSRRNPALRAVYVSGYTADAFPDDTVFGAGQVFLQKPFRADSLLQKIREAIGD